MARIEGLRVRNYKVLKEVTLGRLWNQQNHAPLTPMSAVIGKNGVGKSALFDAFGFLADALRLGVEDACDARGRGGFNRLHTQGTSGPISFELYYRERPKDRPITYEIQIDRDARGRACVTYERLRQRRRGQRHGRPFTFLWLTDGAGIAWEGEQDAGIDEEPDDFRDYVESLGWEESKDREWVELTDQSHLGIATLGALKQHPRIAAFRRFIEGWHLSYFSPDAARSLPLAGPQKHLNVHGDNLGNVVQFMERDYPDRFRTVLDRIADKIPGIDKIDTERTSDGRLLLRFNDRGFGDPFYAQQMSDGTLKVFCYLLLIEDPTPPPFLCIEEPENGLYHKLLEALATEFREHAVHRRGSQVFITTHQPYFVNSLNPDEVWILEKGADGMSTVHRASESPIVANMVAEGVPLGNLWYSDYLDAR
jgi:predicted ATPase